jgi:malonyl-ACP O-methyltransferase BioC
MTSRLYTSQQIKQHFRGQHGSDLSRIMAEDILTRLQDTKRPFPSMLDVGAGTGTLRGVLHPLYGAERYMSVDISAEALAQCGGETLVADVEEDLPLPNGSFDAVVSNMVLHWVNDVPGTLIRLGRLLKPDGIFMASTLGAESFPELKASFAATGSDVPHIIPLTDVKSAGMALQKVGFAMPVVDRELVTLTYPTLAALWQELRESGSRNFHPARQKGLTGKQQWQKMEDHYRRAFSTDDGRVKVTLEVLYLHGWRPHSSQQKPLAPGSATVELAEVLKTVPKK